MINLSFIHFHKWGKWSEPESYKVRTITVDFFGNFTKSDPWTKTIIKRVCLTCNETQEKEI